MYVLDYNSSNPSLAQGDIEIVQNSWTPTSVDPNTQFTVSYQIHNKSTTNTWQTWGYYIDETGTTRDSWTGVLGFGQTAPIQGVFLHPGITTAVSITIYVGHIEDLGCTNPTGTSGQIICGQSAYGQDPTHRYKCTGTAWEDQGACPSGYYCSNGTCTQNPPTGCSSPTGTSGEIICGNATYGQDPNSRYQCNGTSWTSLGTCGTGYECVNGNCQAQGATQVIIPPFPAEQGQVVGAGAYDPGDTVYVTAYPAEGYSFDHWEGDCSNIPNMNCSDPSLSFIMPNYSVTLIPVFASAGLPINPLYIAVGVALVAVVGLVFFIGRSSRNKK